MGISERVREKKIEILNLKMQKYDELGLV
jgi:hypothetical protein